MSYYVKRTSKSNPAGISYVGPIHGELQGRREVQAWEAVGETAELLEATPSLKAEVRRWEAASRGEDAREIVTFHGEQMTMAAYRLNHEQAA